MSGLKQHMAQQNDPVNSPGSSRAFFQPKLSVNQPNDVYEQEADYMADKVMRMKAPVASPGSFFKPSTSAIQRKCHGLEEEDDLHRKESNDVPVTGSDQLGSYVGSLNSSGDPLSAPSRQFFEPRFGQDFSDVRIHSDSVAAKSAQSINALAYTAGNNIVFDDDRYAPETTEGQKLMAHELTHVVQQKNANPSAKIQRDENPDSPDNTDVATADPVAVNDDAAPKKSTVIERQYAFIFDNGPYGQAAELFIRKYNPDHTIIKARSFEDMIDHLYADVSKTKGGKINHVKEIIIVTHANAAGGMKIPLTAADTKTNRFFTPWDLADLQANFKDGLFKTFNEKRSNVVANAIDSDTTVVVRGCNFGQSQQAMDALRIFFGGQPMVFAPTVFQGYEASRIGKGFLPSAEKAFDFLVDQNFLPPELSPAPDVDKKAFMQAQFGNNVVPDEFFVDDQEKHDDLNEKIKSGSGLSAAAEVDKDRNGDVNIPGGNNWGSSSASALGSDSELDGLSQKELEDRATALMNPYKPQNAAMLFRLRDAWTRVTLGNNLSDKSNGDPLAGLPPENIFGDSNILAGDAAKYPMRTPHDDEFMTGTLPSLKDIAASNVKESNTYDDELGAVDKADPSVQAPLNLQGPGNSGGQASYGQDPKGKNNGLGQEMDSLRALGRDFSKSDPKPDPVVTPDPVNPTPVEPVPETTDASKDTPFRIPGITSQFSYLESTALEIALNFGPGVGTMVDAAMALTAITDTTVGIGIQLTGNAVAGVSPSGGLVIRGGRIIGLYGTIAGNLGVSIGVSAEFQVTIIKGGLENFSGESMSATGGGGEVIVGHGSIILNTKGEFIGVSVSGGVGVGITAIEGYMSYQGTGTPSH